MTDPSAAAALPEPARRTLQHTRLVQYRGYQRSDGWWDVEGELLDNKAQQWRSSEKGEMQPGQPVHHMLVRVTFDGGLTVLEANAAMPETPFPECMQARAPLHLLVGASLGPGWRRAIEAALGGARGCAHLRELLFGLGTAAYQTLGPTLEKQAQAATPGGGAQPLRHFGQCVAWDYAGDVMKRHHPAFYRSGDQ